MNCPTMNRTPRIAGVQSKNQYTGRSRHRDATDHLAKSARRKYY